ncbi:MAG: GNAT family N-acetyltransferase [Nanoarchaeota archaeon]|nr:GNAT family N-acetyltransferase [Nanoarchaeota archaeon]
MNNSNASPNEEYVNPSLGKIGEMYFDERNNRIKFFSTTIHSSPDSVRSLIAQGKEMMDDKGATRLNARFFVRDFTLEGNVEAAIPLNSSFRGTQLVFIGINRGKRIDSSEVLLAEEDLIREVLREPLHNCHGLSAGYSFERLTPLNLRPYDIRDMSSLYSQAFTTYTASLDEASLLEMIRNSIVYCARDKDEGKIVSTSVAEIGKVPTSNGNFGICELSEMATLPEHRGRGISTSLTQALVHEISSKVDLIYAEARACSLSVNKVFHNLGFNFAGRLMKQCILSGCYDIEENGPYENLNVWYISPHPRGRT